jgi:acyl-CoA dehydrogenase
MSTAPRSGLKTTASCDVYLDESHKAVRETCRRFAQQEIAPYANEWEEDEIFPAELYKKAAEAGILGVAFPESLGGSAGDALHSLMVTEGLIHGGSTGVIAGLGSLGIALPAIIQSGTPDQLERFARPAIAGELICALGITEPGTGSDVAAVRTRAVKDGDDYRITGNKLFITSGCRADFVTVLARTSDDKHGGLSFFVVEKGMPGFEVSRSLKKTGWRASDTAELAFDDVRVPASNRIGAEGSGFVTLMRNFQTERLMLAGFGYAGAEFCLDEATAYARQRQVFGRPVTAFQVTRHKLADMAMRVLAAKTMTYHVASRMALGEILVAEVSMAKNFTAEVAMQVSYEAVQILGGMGYMRESAVERISRDSRLLPIGGGTQEVMKEIIAKTLAF